MDTLPRFPFRALAAAAAFAMLAGYCPRVGAQATAAEATAKPPRIGLALSGGGARGIAHVGVLKALEEMRVPIHCVTGTSMGAIVGGTYAAGMTTAEMEKKVLEADWDSIFRDVPPRDEISVRRKIDDYKTLFAPEFGVKDGGLALPKGVIAGVSIESFFRLLAAPAFGVTDFNKLPIPFRALATDIETGESVVLERGSIAQAMRASMSVPGAIAPVEIDGKLLVDGGIANNLPINEVRKLCADVVIAVNISTPPLKRDEITSALSVVGQLINFLGKQTVDDQLKSLGGRDVLIAPDLGNISAGKFDRSADAIRIGEEATRALAGSLRRYSLPPERYAAFRANQIAANRALGTVDEIRVAGLQRSNPEVPLEQVQSQPGEPLTEEKIGGDLRRIYGRGDYESISYHITGDGGPRALVIEPREKSWGPDYLRFGLGLASDFQGDNQFNLLFQYRRTWLNRLGGEWLTEAQVGQDTFLASQFYQPLNAAGQWFVDPYFRIGQSTRDVFSGDDNIAEYLVRTRKVGIDAGGVLGTWGQVRLGPLWSRVDARVDTGDGRSCLRPRRTRRESAQPCSSTRPIAPTSRPAASRSKAPPTRRWSRSDRRVTTSGSKGASAGPRAGVRTRSTTRSRAARHWDPKCPPTNPSPSAARSGSRPTASTSSPGASTLTAGWATTTACCPCPTSSGRASSPAARWRRGG